jgi:hypothetical protein
MWWLLTGMDRTRCRCHILERIFRQDEAPLGYLNTRAIHALHPDAAGSGLAELLDPLFEGLTKSFIGTATVARAAFGKRYQYA